jgi:hypothetical protein
MDRFQISLRVLLLILVVTQAPVFLAQTLTPDAVMYDLQARCALTGGVLYRDIFEPNLPGVVWIHMAARSVVGWSSHVLRGFDLLMFAATSCLLSRMVRRSECSTGNRVDWGVFLLLFLFYLGTLEWCHCQRDTWMLPPALVALMFHSRWLKRCAATVRANHWTHFAWGSLEGVFWAISFWIKPHVAIPAICVLSVGRLILRHPRATMMHTLGILTAGILIGAIGVTWMIATGCWDWFLDTMLNWNARYVQSGRDRWSIEKFVVLNRHFSPWFWLHLPGMLISIQSLKRGLTRSSFDQSVPPFEPRVLLSALYIGWTSQAFLLQQPFDYVHVPGLLMAVTLCSGWLAESHHRSLPSHQLLKVACAGFLLSVAISSPLLRPGRLANLPACWAALAGEPLPSDARDAISLIPLPRWTELQPMLDHVTGTGLPMRSLLAHSCHLIHVYPKSGYWPPMRYVYLDVLARLFPENRSLFMQAVADSPARWVIADLVESGWSGAVAEIPTSQLLPEVLVSHPTGKLFPWNQTPVFRSGGYVLFRLDQPVGEISSDSVPLSAVGRGR